MSPVVRANWIMLATAVLLGAFIYAHQKRPPAEYIPITDMDTARIEHILIRRQNKPFAELRKNDAGWINLRSRAPVTDQAWIGNLLHIARLPSLHSFPAAGQDLQAFGLQPPRYQLQLDDSPIHFGGIDPATGLRYIQVEERIHLVSDSYTHYLLRMPDARTPGS